MDDNTFECPNCGAAIYPEVTRCPACGHNMYPLEDEKAQVEKPAPTWLALTGALAIGWMIAAGIAMLTNFVVAAFVSPKFISALGKAILLLAGPFGALVGAYVATSLFKQRYRLIGGLVGTLALPALVLFATYWVEVTPAVLFSPLAILVGFVTILVGVVGGWISETFAPGSDWKERWRVHGMEDLLYQELLRKVRFNGGTADRLIEYERYVDPNATRLKLIQNAIERLDRDNR
ncbi:MAG: hypothetical protein FIA98_04640 [Anaerolineae bacterium]|nr:hypothetical protein [Anaerolineae bacterium]